VPDQNWTRSRLAYCKVKGLPLPFGGPPVVEFQTTWTLRTVIGSWGLVIVMYMVLPDITIDP